jgi:AcrR family transcriptional regulator
MPKPTFYNLPADKRQRVIDAAIDEFAENSFSNAAVNRIVDAAGIAKGSYYQYFTDKEDLFRFLLEVMAEKKMKYLQNMVQNLSTLTFFEIMRELFAGGIQFAVENPKLAAIGNRFVKEYDPVFKEKIMGEMAPKSNQFLEQLVQGAIRKGELDPALNVPFTAYLLTQISIAISEYFHARMGDDNYGGLMPYVEEVMKILRYGIQKPDTYSLEADIE